MIYYFSACGNSKWVAESLAEKTKDKAQSIVDLLKANTPPKKIECGETIGIVFPVYAWTVPKYVVKFLKTLEVDDGAYVYAVATCGSDSNSTFKRFAKHLKLDSGFAIKMPNTYILMFDTDAPEVEKRVIAQAKLRVDYIAQKIIEKVKVIEEIKSSIPFFYSYIVPPFFQLQVKDKRFFAEDTCNSCGLCSKVCAVNNIELKDGKPVWKGNCMHCTACINRCPKRAIQYGSTTKNKGRYYFPE